MLDGFPVFAMARERIPIDEQRDLYRHESFHGRQFVKGGRSLVLFESLDTVHSYKTENPSYADYYSVLIADKMELEEILANARESGATHAAVWHCTDKIRAIDITTFLVALDRLAE